MTEMTGMLRMIGLFIMMISPAFYADKLRSFADVWKYCGMAVLAYIGFSLVLSVIEHIVENRAREARKNQIYWEIMGQKKERLQREAREQRHSGESFMEKKAG